MSDEKPVVGSFCWNELMTADVGKAKEFYGSLLGWTHEDHDMGTMIYTMFKMGEKTVAGMLRTPEGQEEQIPPHWLSYICVEDLDKTLEQAKSLGASILVSKTVIKEYGLFGIIKDPTGAHIAFWQTLMP